MQSFTAVSYEMSNMDFLCNELVSQINENLTLDKVTFGIVIFDSGIDYKTASSKLSKLCSFDIGGCTALATVKKPEEEDISAYFIVLTSGDEIKGSFGLSGPLTVENKAEEIKNTYNLTVDNLGVTPELIISLSPFMPSLILDDITDTINILSDRKPIFGAIASNDLSTDTSGVFLNGNFYSDRSLFFLVGGEIRPLFAVSHLKTEPSYKSGVITKSVNNVIYTVDNESFLEFMKKNGLRTDPSFVLDSCIASYTSSPVLLHRNDFNDGIPVLRVITDINYEDGSVSFATNMPEGSEVSFTVSKRDAVLSSTNICVEDLKRKIQENTTETYKYTSIFAVSCGGRYFTLLSDNVAEGNIFKSHFSSDFKNITGFYAMGEICPTSIDGSGKYVNRSHHCSIALLAF